jgi:hypothetical protein
MRTRRHFQPMLDSMPVRIAPSAVGGLTLVAVTPLVVPPSHTVTMHTDDTNMPETGSSTPIPPSTSGS